MYLWRGRTLLVPEFVFLQANSVFGRELDLPSLGVDFPSGDELQKFLAKGKSRVQNAKKKARELGQKKKKSNGVVKVADEGAGEDSDGAGGVLTREEGSGHGEDAVGTSDGASPAVVNKPYFETTYVDDDFRIGRTGEGDFFVSSRV